MTVRHRVRIRLQYTSPAKTCPWKWVGVCACGWKCLSWEWTREDGSGALSMSLEHAEGANA